MSENNELSNELSRLFSNFRDAYENWEYKGFDSYGFSVGLTIGGGISGGQLEIRNSTEVGDFDLVYSCFGLIGSIGVGLPVNVTAPIDFPISGGIILPYMGRKLDFSSFEGSYVALEFGSSVFLPGLGSSVMAIVFGMPFSHLSFINLSPIEIVRKAYYGKAIIYLFDYQLTGPSMGFNIHYGRSWIYSNDAVFNPIQVPPRGQPILSVGDKIHTVQSGEWLSKIAQNYYGDYTKWEALYNWDWNQGVNKDWNKQQIGNNPNLIEPGMKIIIPPKNVIDRYRK